MDNPNFIKNLEIKNYKSIKHLQMDCKRVNVFIGEPNVGKSNILEAMALLNRNNVSNPHFDNNRFGKEIIRYDKIENLFYDNELEGIIEIKASGKSCILKFQHNNLNSCEYILSTDETLLVFNDSKNPRVHKAGLDYYQAHYNENRHDFKYSYIAVNGKETSIHDLDETEFLPVRYFYYKESEITNNNYNLYLFPPYGENLFRIIFGSNELQKILKDILKKDELELHFIKNDSKIYAAKKNELVLNLFDYKLLASTIKRLMFYLGAIISNKDAVLLFEEPEVHSFPPYIAELAGKIVDKKDNQFFITTHSPYMLNEFIDNLDYSELNINIVYYENYQTKIRTLTEEEIIRIHEIDSDVFFNLDRYI